MANPVLLQWGPLQFSVWPLNIHELDHSTGTDWARKEIAGAAIFREWVGENDDEIYLRGNLFPYRIGGLANLEALEAMRRAGIAALMVRGDGAVLGWYVCEKLIRKHTYLSAQGIGQQLAFEGVFVRVPVPSAADDFPVLWQTIL